MPNTRNTKLRSEPSCAPVTLRKSTGALTGVLHSRRVPLRGPITERTAACCINRLLVLAADNKKQPIVIEIDSMGGLVVDTLPIIRTINGISCPVATFCRGHVGGTAIAIAAHGVKPYRIAMPAAKFTFGSLATSQSESGWHSMVQLLAQDTGLSEQEISQWLSERGGFLPEQAISRNLIDELGAKPVFPESADVAA